MEISTAEQFLCVTPDSVSEGPRRVKAITRLPNIFLLFSNTCLHCNAGLVANVTSCLSLCLISGRGQASIFLLEGTSPRESTIVKKLQGVGNQWG